MDIQKIIREHGPGLVQQLTTKAGFAPDQANSFLTQIVSKIVDLVKGGGIDLKSMLGGADLGAIVGKLGLGQIAKQVGIDEAKATNGAKVILPGITDALKRAGGVGGLVSGAADVLKKAGGLFGQKS